MTASLNLGQVAALRVVPPQASDVIVRAERVADVAAREQLLDEAFGLARFGKTCQRLRQGQAPAYGFALVASDGNRLVGTLRFWNIRAGARPALLLGPLAVAESHRCHGVGSRLIRSGLHRARRLGHGAVLLVGDAPYYARFGFERRFATQLMMPGPVEEERFLGLELVAGSLAGAYGRVTAAAPSAWLAGTSLSQAA